MSEPVRIDVAIYYDPSDDTQHKIYRVEIAERDDATLNDNLRGPECDLAQKGHV